VDHLLALEPADCVLYFKTKMAVNINTMSGWDDDNYDTVTQCQSVWTCFFLSISGFSASWRNILKASGGFAPRSPPGLCPGLSWGTCVPQTTCQCPTQTKIKVLPLEPRWLLAIDNDASSCNNARSFRKALLMFPNYMRYIHRVDSWWYSYYELKNNSTILSH